jgi:hypothetical protein
MNLDAQMREGMHELAGQGDPLVSQHTPTPWIVEYGSYYDVILEASAPSWSPIISTWAGPKPGDAAFIAMACNAHDELVAIARQARRLGISGLSERIDAVLAKVAP